MNILKKSLISTASVLLVGASLVAPTAAFATSATQSTTAPGGKLTSNFWIQSIASGDSGNFLVSAVYNGSANLSSPNYIETSWSFYAEGIDVSVTFMGFGGSAGGSGYSGTSSGYWENNNGATSAWYPGNVIAHGLTFYVGGDNTASMFALGVPASVTAGV